MLLPQPVSSERRSHGAWYAGQSRRWCSELQAQEARQISDTRRTARGRELPIFWQRPSYPSLRLGVRGRGRSGLRLPGGFRGLAQLGGEVLLLADPRLLAAARAQVIELGAADLAAAHDLERVDHRRIEGEHALDAFAV